MTKQTLKAKKEKLELYLGDIGYLYDCIRILQQKIYKLQKEISEQCDHSNYVNFTWEHDSGYGKQTKVTGIRCIHCGKENAWGHIDGLWNYPD